MLLLCSLSKTSKIFNRFQFSCLLDHNSIFGHIGLRLLVITGVRGVPIVSYFCGILDYLGGLFGQEPSLSFEKGGRGWVRDRKKEYNYSFQS